MGWTLLVIGFFTSMSPQDWAAADAATRRLAPSAFSSLPAPIRADLELRGCTVPQPNGAARPANVIRGRFLGPKADDWAVLCSQARFSRILVYRDGQGTVAAELARDADSGYLQTIDGGAVGFSRHLGQATPEQIRRYVARSPTTPFPPVDHDGIEDSFLEKASKVHYFANGKWIVVPGAD